MRVAKGRERNRQELYVANRRPAGYVQRIAASLTLFLFMSPYLVPGKLNSLSVSVSEIPFLRALILQGGLATTWTIVCR